MRRGGLRRHALGPSGRDEQWASGFPAQGVLSAPNEQIARAAARITFGFVADAENRHQSAAERNGGRGSGGRRERTPTASASGACDDDQQSGNQTPHHLRAGHSRPCWSSPSLGADASSSSSFPRSRARHETRPLSGLHVPEKTRLRTRSAAWGLYHQREQPDGRQGV
jgi:hypothetical protein